MGLGSTIFFLGLGGLVSVPVIAYFFPPEMSRTGVSVQILVLGDIGRSPRMTYHALSVARHGGDVDLVGYVESPLHPDLLYQDNIRVHALPPPPRRPQYIPFLIFGPYKALSQLWSLTWLLMYRLRPAKWLLVQNPPSVPTLLIASVTCFLRKTKLIIDWHNYGWTILAGTRGARHPLVRISKAYECFFGRLGSFNFTVTEAMGRQLRQAPFDIRSPILTVHDRPLSIFKPIHSQVGRKAILSRILAGHELLPDIIDGSARLIVSSTSWTPDENFSLLLDALVMYSNGAAGRLPSAPVLALITGKGPQKDAYVERIASLRVAGSLPGIMIETAFLTFPDYAALLACADLGVCLHMSTSGVDLPMKIVDMFGAGLPVVAYSGYESFGELVHEGWNGRGFQTAEGLAVTLGRLLSDGGRDELEYLRKGAIKEGSRRWDEQWDSIVAPVLGLVG